MKRRTFLKNSSTAGLAALIMPSGIIQIGKKTATAEPFADAFMNPPMSARAQCWWHWMNGNVTADGITRDLEAMQQIGLGGFQNFDAGTGIPKGPVVYLSPEWLSLKQHAMTEAARLGLEFTMHNCPGWSSSGGPWITPELAMQEMTWSEAYVSGGSAVTVSLPKPLSKLDYYRDVAVMAFPALPGETASLAPVAPPAGVPPQRRGNQLPELPNRLTDWQKKTNRAFGNTGVSENPKDNDKATINPASIVDVTQYMDKDGSLNWTPPATGIWTIMRVGYTPKGELNRSAPDTGVGLECDKYNPAAIDFHFNKMMEHLLPTLEPIAKKGKVGVLIDSYEVGMQNWTAQFPSEFQKRAGYSSLTYLPTLTGRIVGSVDTTERFLWDFRRVQADLMAENYYGRFRDLCHQHNLIAYAEPYDRGPMEEMQIGARMDVNMGEFWNGLSSLFQNNWTMRRTTKLAASIAHINGRQNGGGTPGEPQVVGAEAFTGEPESARWQEYPFAMKALGDKMFTQGLNRIIFHRYAHQPHPTAVPGMTMGPWGIHFDRTTTWWKQGRAWLDYIARCQTLLQQGLFIADLAYFTGEEGNEYAKVLPDELTPSPPEGYDYDLINAETLVKHARMEKGNLTLPDGMNYRVLVLQNHNALSVSLLRKLRQLVSDGLVLVGAKPTKSLGLHPAGESEFTRLTNEIWGNASGTTSAENRLGNGRVFVNTSINDVLNALAIRPDVVVSSRSGSAPITWIHRRVGDAHIYFLANQRRTTEDVVCTFRVAGLQPELWDAATGKQTPIRFYETTDGQTRLPLQLDPAGSAFVVFRSTTSGRQLQTLVSGNQTLLSTKPFSAPAPKRYPAVTDIFTISLWAKPELNIALDTKGFMDTIKDPWTDNYAIYPPSGAALYGEGHAACGLTIGRNGVAIWERTAGKPVFKLAAPTPISGWSHVAVVYKDGSPSIYVNGKRIQQGQKGTNVVHPGLGQALLRDGASFYNGDMTEPQLLTEALPDDRIQQMAAQERPNTMSLPAVEMAAGGQSALLFWQNGQYGLRDSTGRNTPLVVSGIKPSQELTAPWQVIFPSNMGAPERITLSKLMPLNQYEQEGVKYFSGTATYRTTFQVPRSLFQVSAGSQASRRLFLDLGRVEVLASVKLNGKDLGTLWKRPYQIDITDAVKQGDNALEIQVTNLWPNRLIGDEHLPDPDKFTPGGGASGFASLSNGAIVELPAWYKEGKPKPTDGRVAFTTWKHYTKDSPLLDSGLIGPVMLRVAKWKNLT
jgi:hypothetical protein